jgi:DNA-binding response OmpR family regulator
MMPEMDGFQVLEALKQDESTESLPVIMLTARTDARDMFRAWDMGTSIYLTKPFRPRELVAAVKRIFPGDEEVEPPKFFTQGQ